MLIIFVDAFPYERVGDFKEKIYLPLNICKLRPGFGYSVNLHNEIFAGLGPDDIGYFGEWNFVGFSKDSDLKKRFYKMVEKFPKAFRIWRLVLNKLFRLKKFYIPSRFTNNFERAGLYPLVERGRVDDILKKFNFSFCVADEVRAPLNKKDVPTLESALKMVNVGSRRNIVVSFCDLDGVFHEYGSKNEVVEEKINWLSRNINELIDNYHSTHAGADIVILSDHGICDVSRTISLDLRDFSDYVESEVLVYFYDSLYFSVWSKDPEALEKLNEILVGTYDLVRLTQKDREDGRLTNRKFGDEIYVCPEGACFSPNYFGFRTLKAYHGYHPSLDKSAGIFLANFPIPSAMNTLDVHAELYDRCATV